MPIMEASSHSWARIAGHAESQVPRGATSCLVPGGQEGNGSSLPVKVVGHARAVKCRLLEIDRAAESLAESGEEKLNKLPSLFEP